MITDFCIKYPAAQLILVTVYAVLFGAAATAVVTFTAVPESSDIWIGFAAAVLTCLFTLATYAWILRDKS